jgi:tRNA-splicing ligase RtcB
MFVTQVTDGKPIKVWLESELDVELGCLEQAANLSQLPFILSHVVLMPDTHKGYGMPIGGVIATQDVIIPNAVGVDIGCGMRYVSTEIPVKDFRIFLPEIVEKIMARIPIGFNHHKEAQNCPAIEKVNVWDGEFEQMLSAPELKPELQRGLYQVGTLGGGNHFIELQEDTERGTMSIMLHSGSRNFGLKIARLFNEKAKKLNKEWFSSVPTQHDLAFLPIDSDEGKLYLWWMHLALEFAYENRQHMMGVIENIILEYTDGPGFSGAIDVHHNYAAIEHHFGKDVWVHRKGAIRARDGEVGIIPGSMGSFSYIVKGKGNKDSFQSCSHGAGRKMSRKKASELFPSNLVMSELAHKGIVVGVPDPSKVGDECVGAYKDIKYVIEQEADLIEVITELKTIAVVKG